MASIRVLHVRNSGRVSGPERLIMEQCRRSADDIEPSLAVFVTTGDANPFLAVARDAGIEAAALPQKSSYDRSVGKRLATHCARSKPDILVTHDYKANLVGRSVGKQLGIPVVAVVHGYTAETLRVRVFEMLDRRGLKRFDAVVAVSDAMEARLRKCGVREERLFRIENTIDADSIAMAALAARAKTRAKWVHGDDERVIVSVGRLSREKGHGDLLEALTRIESDTWRLILVGSGRQEAALRETARTAGLASRIVFTGWVADAAAALGAADMFVLPSHTEGLPLALLEAMAVGLPIVATRVGGVPRALNDGECGRLVEPQNAVALTAAIDQLLGEPDVAERLGAAAARRVRTHYGAEKQIQALEGLYRSLVS